MAVRELPGGNRVAAAEHAQKAAPVVGLDWDVVDLIIICSMPQQVMKYTLQKCKVKLY